MSTIDNPQALIPVVTPPYGPPAPFLAPVGATGEPEAPPALTAKDMWRVVKQRKVLIVITFSLLFLASCAATYLTWQLAPLYSNEAFILLNAPMQSWNSLQQAILPKEYITHRLATESQKIKDPAVLLKVLERPEIKETQYYKQFEGDFNECMYDFQRNLAVAPVRDTMAIRIGFRTRSRDEARLVVNTVVSVYTAWAQDQSTNVDQGRIDTLKDTQAKALQDLTAVRLQINNIRATRDMPAIESQRDVMVESIAVLTNTIAELRTRESDVLAQLGTIRGVDPRNLPVSAEMRVIVEADPVLRYYRQQVEMLDIQIDVAKRSLFGENHRQMQTLVAQREAYSQKEAARREELLGDLRGRQVESLQQEQARIRNMLGKVSEQLMEKEATQKDLDGAIQRFRELTADEERLNRQMEDIGRVYREAENAFQVQKREGQLDRLLATRDPLWPSRPSFAAFIGGGFVVSLLTALGLAFLRELTDQAIRTPIDVVRHGKLSVLGTVPFLDEEEVDIDQIEYATRRARHSLVAEGFRQIRAQLLFSGPLETQQLLLVTSPGPEEGKTSTAVNLAVTFAQGNQRVLLIDANFRRPGIHTWFGKTHAEGLSNVLVGQCPLERAITPTDVGNLDVIVSGPMPPNPAELLGSEQMRAFLATVRQAYQRVIVDGPPCLLISDALVAATQVDAVLVVARAGASTKGMLRRAREQLHRTGARVIGAVLNAVRARPGGYFRQQSRDFYEYSSQEVVSPAATQALPELEADRQLEDERKDT